MGQVLEDGVLVPIKLGSDSDSDLPDKISPWSNLPDQIDTILMNPPFGTKNNKGIDLNFVKAAMNLKPQAIYSLHKSSTRDFLTRKIAKLDPTYSVEVLAQMRYDLENTYKFHKKKSVDIEIDLLRIFLK